MQPSDSDRGQLSHLLLLIFSSQNYRCTPQKIALTAKGKHYYTRPYAIQ
jgi:hypothetical protein